MRPGPPGASWRLTAVLLGLFGALTSPVAAQGNLPDLGAVLAKNANLSTYYDLMKVSRRPARIVGRRWGGPRLTRTEIPRHLAPTAQRPRLDSESRSAPNGRVRR